MTVFRRILRPALQHSRSAKQETRRGKKSMKKEVIGNIHENMELLEMENAK
jgi:hypothetical protein